MSTPGRTQITAAIEAALKRISLQNGFRSEIGRIVFVASRRVNEGEQPCCVLTPGTETPIDNAGPGGAVEIAYTVSAYSNRLAAMGLQEEYETVDAIIADVRLSVEGDGESACPIVPARSVVYTGASPIYSESGGEMCGADLQYTIQTRSTE